ncbi:MAG: AI-2E family transporter [Sphingomicrobium sp.]
MTKRAAETDDRRFVRRVLIVLALTALVILTWHLRHLVLMLFGAVVVATIFRALADRIAKLAGCRQGIAMAASIAVILGAVVALAALFGANLVGRMDVLATRLPAAWTSFEARIGDMGLGEQLRQMVESAGKGGSFATFSRTVLSIGNSIAEALVVIFAGIFLAMQPRFYRTGAIKLVPPGQRTLVAEAMDESERALHLWLTGQLIAMVVVGLLTGFGLWLLGVPSAFALGLLAGLLEFVPFAGPLIAALPAVLLALAVSPDLAIWVALLYFAVQQFEGYLLTPLVQQYAVDLPGVVMLFSLLAFGAIFGVLGVILAAPLSVVTYVLIKRLYVIEALHTATPIPGEDKK